MKKNYLTPTVALYEIGMEGPICANSVELRIVRTGIEYEDYDAITETHEVSLL
jgi:hypothetical protein